MIKPFHELTLAEHQEIVDKHPDMTWAEFAEKYPRPEWCDYAGAVHGAMGCWSLMAHTITGPESCRNCEFKRRME